MMTAHIRRLADRFSGWVETFPEGPFEGSNLYAALAKAELSIEVVAAELGVTPDRLEAYTEEGVPALAVPQRRALKRIFARRGVFEIILPGLQGVVVVLPILRRAAVRRAQSLAVARRIIAVLDGRRPGE